MTQQDKNSHYILANSLIKKDLGINLAREMDGDNNCYGLSKDGGLISSKDEAERIERYLNEDARFNNLFNVSANSNTAKIYVSLKGEKGINSAGMCYIGNNNSGE